LLNSYGGTAPTVLDCGPLADRLRCEHRRRHSAVRRGGDDLRAVETGHYVSTAAPPSTSNSAPASPLVRK